MNHNGILVTYNQGCMIRVPHGSAPVHYQMIDMDTGILNHSGIIMPPQPPNLYSMRMSTKRYFVNWKVILDRGTEHYEETINLKGMPVLIHGMGLVLGDFLSSISGVDEFQRKHQCRLYMSIKKVYLPLVEKTYKNITFLTEDRDVIALMKTVYAEYGLSVFVIGGNAIFNKIKVPEFPLWAYSRFNLGVDIKEVPAKITGKIPKKEDDLVVICPGASQICKLWNYPNAWQTVVDYLVSKGYRVLCMDKKHIDLNNVIDDTGDKPLLDRVETMRKAILCITGPSGLGWISWSVGTPVLMISGYSDHGAEYSCYEVRATSECHGCWHTYIPTLNRETFEKHKVCPYHAGTPRQHECWKSITPERVIKELDRALSEIKK